jgi:prepilin-type N-terminal cleavage/methylation domain-containing protein
MNFQMADFRWQTGAAKRAGAVSGRNRQFAIASSRGFTLVEILIVVGLLSVIILGLLAMFGQTQRAFRLGMTQTDVLESGRMATDLMVRELEQMTPSLPGVNRTSAHYLNFYAFQPDYAPLVQPLPGSRFPRTNLLYDVFFITRRNQEWVGIGYAVRTHNPANAGNPSVPDLSWPVVQGDTPTLGAGTLYRFETNAPDLSGRTPAQMYTEFYQAMQKKSRVSEIMGGVVQFSVRAFNTNGYWIVSDLDVSRSGTQTNTVILPSTVAPGEVGQYAFYDNAVPASVELELGILEDRAWERYQSLYPDTAAQYRYLVNQAGRVHLFRQRIPIRSVDPQAYR